MNKKPIVCTCACSLLLVFLLAAYCILPAVLYAQAPDTLWTKTYGGTGDDYGYSVQQTTDGGYIIVGWTESFGAGQSDVYLIKTDSFGDTLWTKTYGGSNNEWGYSVQQTTDGGYIIVGSTISFGAGQADVYLIKTNSSGNTIWIKTHGGKAGDIGYSVQQTTDGGYIIVGLTISFGVYGGDVYLLKTDSLGDTLWTKTYGGAESDIGKSVKQAPDGGYIIAGQSFSFSGFFPNIYLIKTNSLGDTVWARTYGGAYDSWEDGYSIQLTTDGGYIVAGYTDAFGAPYHDVYLVKINSLGDTVWTRAYDGSDNDGGYTVSLTADDGYIIAGETESFGTGGYDVYLIKSDSMGDTIWTMTYGGTDDDYGYSVQQTSDSSYIIAGTTESFGAGGEDVYLIKTEPDQGINEHQTASVNNRQITATIFRGPLQLPEGRKCKVFDITGRVVLPETMKPGVYFIEIDGFVTQKVVKIR